MRVIIDRFEGEFAVVELETKEMVNLPIILLPSEAKEGDVINILVDESETEIRRRRIQDKFDQLFEKR